MRKERLRDATGKESEKRSRRLSSKLGMGEKRGRKRMATVATVYNVEPYKRTADEVVAELFTRIRPVGCEWPRPESKRVWASLEKTAEEVIRIQANRTRTTFASGTGSWR